MEMKEELWFSRGFSIETETERDFRSSELQEEVVTRLLHGNHVIYAVDIHCGAHV